MSETPLTDAAVAESLEMSKRGEAWATPVSATLAYSLERQLAEARAVMKSALEILPASYGTSESFEKQMAVMIKLKEGLNARP